MNEQEYLERGEHKLRSIFKNEADHEHVDWTAAREALREHHAQHTPHAEAVRKVFFDRLARKLFYHGDPVAPIPKPGVQSAVTPLVEEFAHSVLPFKHVTPKLLEQLKRDPKKLLHFANDLVRKVHNSFEAVPLEFEYARRLYGSQTAEDVIHTKRVPSSGTFGCAHACVALAASLRALGIKAWYVRTVHNWYDILGAPRDEKKFAFGDPHSVVEFVIGRKHYAADPWVGGYVLPLEGLARERLGTVMGVSHPEPLTKETRRLRHGKHRWVRGTDSWGLGILTFSHYTRHIGPGGGTHPPVPT